MTIQEFKSLYFREQLEIFNEYQDENCLDDRIYYNDAETISCLYNSLQDLLNDLSENNYNARHDFFSITNYGLETFDRPKAQEIINDTCKDILFKNWLEDYEI